MKQKEHQIFRLLNNDKEINLCWMQLVDVSLNLIRSKFHCTLCAETTWLAHPAVKAPDHSAEKNSKKQCALIQPTIKTTFQTSSVPHPRLRVLRVVTVNAAGFNQGHSDIMQTHTCRTRWRIYSKQRTWHTGSPAINLRWKHANEPRWPSAPLLCCTTK